MKTRILLVFAGLILLWTGLLVRAGSLQIFPNERLRALKERQFQTVVTLQSRRGAIVDRKGRDLALSTRAFSIYADPKILEDKKALARKLARLLGQSPESIYPKLRGTDRRFTWIARQVSKEKAEAIRGWDVRGLSVIDEFQRVYPNETLLAHTLGMVGSEGQGQEGLELAYDQQLRGNKKKISVRRDARGRPLLMNGLMMADEADGAEVHLTVDSEIQHMLENELQQAVQEFDADQAFGVILDAQTSAIVAMVNTPLFDANHAGRTPSEMRRNRVVTDTFEPGSTMKTFLIAKGLHDKILAPNKKYNTENGVFKVADHFIREAEAKDVWSHLTVSEILAFSSNIGATKIAFEMGPDRLRQGLADFGFGAKSGVDLPGEAHGLLAPLPWNQHLLSNISFGQGVSATPLQIANAYAAIANGGILNTPYLVQSVRDPETGELVESKVKPIRRVLSPEEAEQMRIMLLGVTSPGGTGVNANVEGFLVAGKTGTAQKADPNGRGYMPKAFVSSFAGFFPANNPKFVIYVAVDHPKKTSHFGATVAAPVFSRVASYAARLEGLAPVLLTEKNLIPAPAYKTTEVAASSKRRRQTKEVIKRSSLGRGIASTGAGPQKPVAPPPPMLTTADLLAPNKNPSLETVPLLHSQSLRDVLRKLSGQNIDLQIIGSGTVSETIPAEGSPLGPDRKLKVLLK